MVRMEMVRIADKKKNRTWERYGCFEGSLGNTIKRGGPGYDLERDGGYGWCSPLCYCHWEEEPDSGSTWYCYMQVIGRITA